MQLLILLAPTIVGAIIGVLGFLVTTWVLSKIDSF